MEDYKLTEKQKSGFSFENCLRNNYLEKKGYEVPKPFKTGTTIVGVIFNGGVVLGADTRATDDTTVADKNCSKIHYLQPNIYCCGAGTAADTEQVTGMVSSNMELHRLYTKRVVPVVTACRMLKQFLFRYQGHIGAALVLGGVDATGPHLYSVAPHGSTDKVPYTTMGSGSLAAMAVLESGWYKDIEEEAAKELVCAAITSGILNDLGSGSNVDLCVIKKDYSVDYIRPYKEISVKGKRIGDYQFPIGTTKLIAPPILVELTIEDESVVSVARESMDTS